MHECTDRIPDMSCLDSKCSRHRQVGVTAARLRAGLWLTPLAHRGRRDQRASGLGMAKCPRHLGSDSSSPRSLDTAIAKILKLADKTSNLRAIAASPPPDWSMKRRLDYVKWACEVAKGLSGVSEWLEQEFDQAAKEVQRSTV